MHSGPCDLWPIFLTCLMRPFFYVWLYIRQLSSQTLTSSPALPHPLPHSRLLQAMLCPDLCLPSSSCCFFFSSSLLKKMYHLLVLMSDILNREKVFNKTKPFMYQTYYCNKRKMCLLIMRTDDEVAGKFVCKPSNLCRIDFKKWKIRNTNYWVMTQLWKFWDVCPFPPLIAQRPEFLLASCLRMHFYWSPAVQRDDGQDQQSKRHGGTLPPWEYLHFLKKPATEFRNLFHEHQWTRQKWTTAGKLLGKQHLK